MKQINKTNNAFLNILKSYSNQIKKLEEIDIFVETGTFFGDSALAFSEYFDSVFTVELLPSADKSQRYKEIQQTTTNIKFIFGNSGDVLKDILSNIENKRCVFLLDAHNGNSSPLREELNAILHYSKINDHVIIIDDCSDLGSGNWPTFDELKEILSQINSNYKIYETGVGRRVLIIF